jgi:predicted transcriptional regulator
MTSDPITIETENIFQEDIRTMEKNRIGNCIIGEDRCCIGKSSLAS